MRTNCNTFSFRDCCFLIQKDREGASRVKLPLFRLLCGRNWTLQTALHWRYLSVGPMRANMSTNISIWTTIEPWPKLFASPSMICMSLSKLRWNKWCQTWNKIYWNMRNSAMMIQGAMILITRTRTKLSPNRSNKRMIGMRAKTR